MNEERGNSSNLLAISILVAALVIGGSLVWSASLRGDTRGLAEVTENTGGSQPSNNNNLSSDDDVILGDEAAPVTLVSFGDYQCPFCRKMFEEVESRLRNDYIKTGKLKMVYRDFPIDSLHPYARGAAEAAECARDQGRYWMYHDLLFEKQSEIPRMDFVSEAGKLGLNAAQFRQCYESKKYAAEVEKDYQDGIGAGVTGTPGNFIFASGDSSQSKFLPGALPYEAFKAAIEEALSR